MTSSLHSNDLRAGLPAALLGSCALLIVVLGNVLATPRRMDRSYELREQRALQEYELALESNAGIEQLNTIAEEIDIINARLVGVRGDDPSQYWSWAKFLERHAAVLQKYGEPTNSSEPDMSSHLDKYEANAQKLYAGLAAGNSEFALGALVRVSAFETSEILAGRLVPSESSIVKIHAALNQLSDTPSVEMQTLGRQLRWCLVAQQIELAWGRSSSLSFGIDILRDGLNWCRHRDAPGFEGFVAICSAFATSAVQPGARPNVGSDTESWKGKYSELLLQSVAGEWNDVAFLLARKNTDNPEAVRLGTARWICRLAVSEKAKLDAEWRNSYAAGLQIVLQIAPQIPELAELVWLMADQHARASEEGASGDNGMKHIDVSEASGEDSPLGDVALPVELVDAVIGGRAVAVRHIVLAFSSMLNSAMDVTRSHLQLTLRSSGTLMQVSQIALGRLRNPLASDSDVARLVELMGIVVELEPASGLNWFVLGVAQQRQGALADAESSLVKADELLPQTDAINELLESVRSNRSREERESQLRPVE